MYTLLSMSATSETFQCWLKRVESGANTQSALQHMRYAMDAVFVVSYEPLVDSCAVSRLYDGYLAFPEMGGCSSVAPLQGLYRCNAIAAIQNQQLIVT